MSELPPDARASATRGHARMVEQRIVGINACLAAFSHRPQDLRKLWLTADRQQILRPMLGWCVKNRIGYRVVDAMEIERISGSVHHEGVCAAFLRKPQGGLASLLRALPTGPVLLLWFEGVGNPHNLGAVLRSAAHFGVAGVLLSQDDPLSLSPSAMRVAEGGAEVIPVLRLQHRDEALAQLRSAGFVVAATMPNDAESLYTAPLPERVVLWLGAEGAGLPSPARSSADMRIRIPGTGAVESLNVSVAAAVLAGEWYRRYRVGAS